jgi:hypothetical protein
LYHSGIQSYLSIMIFNSQSLSTVADLVQYQHLLEEEFIIKRFFHRISNEKDLSQNWQCKRLLKSYPYRIYQTPHPLCMFLDCLYSTIIHSSWKYLEGSRRVKNGSCASDDLIILFSCMIDMSVSWG